MGPIEAEMLARYREARDRLNVPRTLPPKPIPRRLLSPFSAERNPPPPLPVTAVDLLTSPSWKTITLLVAHKHGLTLGEVVGPLRARKYVRARFEAIALIYTHTNMSLPAIGRRFNRDHTSALHAIRAMGVPLRDKWFDWSPEAEATLRQLWADGLYMRHIAREMGTTFGTISARVVKLNLPTRTGKERTFTDWEKVNSRRRGTKILPAFHRPTPHETGTSVFSRGQTTLISTKARTPTDSAPKVVI
jgi:hypothetical protein